MQEKYPFFVMTRVRNATMTGGGNVALVFIFFIGIGAIVSIGVGVTQPELIRNGLGMMFAVLCGFAVFNGLIIYTMMWLSNPIHQQRRLLQGEKWAEWRIPQHVWKKFVGTYPDADKPRTNPRTSIIVGILFAAGITALAFAGRPDMMLPIMLPVALFMGTLYTGLGLVMARRERSAIRKRQRLYAERYGAGNDPILVIGRNGVFHEIEGFLRFPIIRDVAVDGDLLVFTVQMPRGRYGMVAVLITVPIPPGCEKEARAIVERVRAKRQ
jgi:hypothetical protein